MPISAAVPTSSSGLATPNPKEKPLLTCRWAKESPVNPASDEVPFFAVLPRQVDHRAVREEHPEEAPVRRPLLVPPRPDLPPAAEDLDDSPLPAAPPSARRPGDPHESVTVLYVNRFPPGVGGLSSPALCLRSPREPGRLQQVIQDLEPRFPGREQRLLEALGPGRVAVYLRDVRLHKTPPSGERPSRGMGNPQDRI